MPRNPAKKPTPAKANKPKPPEETSAPPVRVIERRVETVTVKVPLGEPPHGFQNIHVEANLNKEHAQTWAEVRQGLRDENSKTKDGKDVWSGAEIIRWLMEKIKDKEV